MLALIISMTSGIFGSIGPQPSVSAVGVSTGVSGNCDGTTLATPASVIIAWTVTNPNSNFTITVLENGTVLESGLPCTTSSITKSISAVLNGASARFTSNWIYTVHVVRTADSVIVSTASSAEWTHIYGSCGNSFQ
jgi:hypothetical protein